MTPIRYIIVGAVFTGCYLSYYIGYSMNDAKWLKVVAKNAEIHQQAVKDTVAKYNATVSQLEKSNEDAKTQLSMVTVAAERADASASRLQQQLEAIASSAGASDKTATVDRKCASTATTIVVLTDVLRRADKRAGELAATADQARVRGLACEASYDILAGE